MKNAFVRLYVYRVDLAHTLIIPDRSCQFQGEVSQSDCDRSFRPYCVFTSTLIDTFATVTESKCPSKTR
jgi:hypothetical protein